MKKPLSYMCSKKIQYLLIVCMLFSYSFTHAQVNCDNFLFDQEMTITVAGSTTPDNPSYYKPPVNISNSFQQCTPSAGFAGSPPSWTGYIIGGIVTYTFSQPIISARVTWTSVNSDAVDLDIGEITIDGQGVLSLSDPCGVDISGNHLTCTLPSEIPGQQTAGNVAVTVSSNCPFTTITLTNISGASGWVQGNTCNFTWTEACDIYAPIFSSYSLGNTCPSETVDLSLLDANNQIFCYDLTWHTSDVADDTNLLSPITSVGAGTYYASFTYSDGDYTCYSETTEVIVNITPCNPDCLSDATLTSPDDNMTNLFPDSIKLIERENWIEASNTIGVGDNTFLNGVVYHAGEYIELNQGFESVFQSQFSAYIEGCSDDFAYRSENTLPTFRQEVKEGLIIMPNPSKDYIKIRLLDITFTRVIITSIERRIVLDKQVKSTETMSLNINNFQKGIYLVSVVSDEGKVYSSKLIKE